MQTLGVSKIIEDVGTRDHTQRLLKYLKAGIEIKEKKGKRITKINGQVEIQNFSIKVPSDPSSACFFVVQTLLAKNSSLLIKNVCVNKNRIGFSYGHISNANIGDSNPGVEVLSILYQVAY